MDKQERKDSVVQVLGLALGGHWLIYLQTRDCTRTELCGLVGRCGGGSLACSSGCFSFLSEGGRKVINRV